MSEHAVEPSQLSQIKAHLDLVLLALEALAEISSEVMLKAARDLKLQDVLGDRITLWRLRQASPLRKGKGGRKKLDVDEARAIALICSHLAAQSQLKIRSAVADLEKATLQKRSPSLEPAIGDYLDRFYALYQERMAEEDATIPTEALQRLALKLLIDLLFYSAPNGSRRLWISLLERSLVHG